MTDAGTVARFFTETVGRPPAGVWSAPGRVNLIGEHTDYTEGVVFPFAIDRRAFLAADRNDDDVIRIQSVQRPDDVIEVAIADLEPRGDHHWSAYVLGSVWALREAGHDVRGLDIVLESTVPLGSGLSSSAAVECATLLAAAALYDIPVDGYPFALLAQRGENEYVGMPCGSMDQTASMMGNAGSALFYDTQNGEIVLEPFEPGQAGLALVVIDTRAHHALADGEYAKRRASCEEATRRLGVPSLRHVSVDGLNDALAKLDADLGRHVRHVVTENARVFAARRALRAGDYAELGRLLDASHASLKDDFRVSADELDVAVDAARSAGALGARMTGGGFGGSAIALVGIEGIETLSDAVRRAYVERGFEEPSIWVVEPSDGAHQDA
ncbi:MAG: galactokinase [Thermoleophilaceae bacterium]|nr:galactokinase [Thermoleophilaceae bacterium]